ncbi:MAG: hypothetical protein ACOC7W_08340, partial [Desulfosalsimonas sp.]
MSRSRAKIQTLWLAALSALLVCVLALPAAAQDVNAEIDRQSYLAGDDVTISGQIEPGEDLFIAISSEREFRIDEATGVNEVKRFRRAADENPFETDTS